MKRFACTLPIVLYSCFCTLFAQTTTNKHFSFGSYGRVGVGYSPTMKAHTPRSLNLLGMGSIGGRLEEQDYVELLAALHFYPATKKKDTTIINVQARMAMYTAGAQFIGNVTSLSIRGLTIALPELYVEANRINGSDWSVWAGARFFRSNDVHIADHFYFDDHSSQGFGVSYKNTTLGMIFPAAIDTNATYPPYFYLNIVNGTPTLALRQRSVAIGEHTINFRNGSDLKLLAEFQRLSAATSADTTASTDYPSDLGWVIGAKYINKLNTRMPGSFNQVAVRYGAGIANGGDGGSSRTWLTYGAPNLETGRFKKAYSLAIVEHFLFNFSRQFSLNGYGIFTKSRGASDSTNKGLDYFSRPLFNRKTDLAVGFRGFWYAKNWFHVLGELSYAQRKDGDQPNAAMVKFGIAPTLVPTGVRDPWARPHIRLVFTAARYNKFAREALYSPFLQQAGQRNWGSYIGLKTEWWLY